MSVHEQMSDDEVLRTVAGVLSALPVTGPPEATAIMGRGGRRPGAAPRAGWAPWLLSWRGPVAAVAVVLLVAAVLVGLRSLRDEYPVPVTTHSGPIAGPPLPDGVAPRYFVATRVVPDAKGEDGFSLGWVATDTRTGTDVGHVLLPGPQPELEEPVAAAADDRTFVVAEAVTRQKEVKGPGQRTTIFGQPVVESVKWYLLRLFPGSADPVRMTGLPIRYTAGDGPVSATALSGDGSELAVAFQAGRRVTLRVYSVASGQQQHSWSATLAAPPIHYAPVSDLSWVGDRTVGFAVTYTPKVREEVRTLDITAGGSDLFASSRFVWGEYFPAPPHGVYKEGSLQVCSSPVLSGNGQVVVCATSMYSASDKRLTAIWEAYPARTRARTPVTVLGLGSIPQPKNVSSLSPDSSVEWTNASGTQVIGTWNPTVVTFAGTNHSVSTTTNYAGIIGGHTVRVLPAIAGQNAAGAAW